MDLILRRARLQSGDVVDIGVMDGRIVALETGISATAAQELDAGERLTLPAFVNGQLHACKSFWRRLLHTLPDAVRALPRFEAAAYVKRLYTVEDVFARVDETMRLAILNGTCAIRLFADVDADSGLTALEGLLRIREKYSPLMTVQIVAFPQDGFAAPGTESLMRQALEMGADVVGGIPWIEDPAEAQRRHTDACFALAQAYDRDLHFVCDDVADPQSRSLAYVAQQTLAHNFHGRVSATQCAALAFYPDDYAAKVIDTVAAAGMTIFSNSHVSLIATDFPPQQPWPRGITRVRQLLDRGVPVACAQDDIDNWFYPFGRNDLLEVAQFMAHNGQFAWNGEVDRVLPMITTTPARVLGLDDYGLQIGAAANLLVLNAADWHEAIQFQADKRFVILRGKLAAQTERRNEIFTNRQ
ncbi:MAG: amidohydrolase family protein [Caldilineaceae bacterium]|nr:amidohydrolase family protein [Caldilineaceae bacterium]